MQRPEWNPLRDLIAMRAMMRRLLEEPFAQRGSTLPGCHYLPLDIRTTDNAFIIYADLPGVQPDKVDVTVEGDTLTIRADLPQPEEDDYIVRERTRGPVGRKITFNVPINPEAIEATFEHGQLTLTVPKADTVKPRTIPIQSK